MQTIESIPIVLGHEADGLWRADIESMPGVMTYGPTRESAIDAVRVLALRVAADCLEHGEAVPEPFAKMFTLAGATAHRQSQAVARGSAAYPTDRGLAERLAPSPEARRLAELHLRFSH